MAYKDSGELSVGQSYQLGAYNISLTATTDPGEVTTGINVRCDIGGKRARASAEVIGTVTGWHVEANDTTADVYVSVKPPEGPDIPAPFYKPVPSSPGQAVGYYRADSNRVLVGLGSNAMGTATWTNDLSDGTFNLLLAQSDNPNPFADFLVADRHYGYVQGGSSYTYKGKTVYYATSLNANYSGIAPPVGYDVNRPFWGDNNSAAGPIAWQMLYGDKSGEIPESLIARFAIDLHDAGGTGPGSDWDDPGDYNPDPSTILRLNVTGASAGMHGTDAPTAPAQQQNYGSGGNGGGGGGGGAGASTVIVNKFSTERANSKEIAATARGPGVGSKGSAGGKGGDGCILIFW